MWTMRAMSSITALNSLRPTRKNATKRPWSSLLRLSSPLHALEPRSTLALRSNQTPPSTSISVASAARTSWARPLALALTWSLCCMGGRVANPEQPPSPPPP